MRREIEDRELALDEYRARDANRERELNELFVQLTQKDSLMSECEKRLLKGIREKEQECA